MIKTAFGFKLAAVLIGVIVLSAHFALMESSAQVTPAGDEWPMFNHDPAHTSYSTSSVPVNLGLEWSFPNPNITSVIQGSIHVVSTPAISSGRLYVSGAGSDAGFYCLNAQTGNIIWNKTINNKNPTSPALYDGVVYTGISTNLIIALNASTGSQIWMGDRSYNCSGSSPVVVDGVLYTQGNYGLYALNASTGKQIWGYPDLGSYAGSVSPAVAYGCVFAATMENPESVTAYAFALNASTGKEIWRFYTGYLAQSSPAVYEGMVYVGSDGGVCALNASTGEQIWNYPTGFAVISAPAVAYNVVYVGSLDGNIYALKTGTGEKLWSKSMNIGSLPASSVHSSPAVADGVVYVSDDYYYLHALNASNGDELWKALTITASDYKATYVYMYASPAVADGRVYIGTNEGNVLAFGEVFGPSNPTPSPTVPEIPAQAAVTALIVSAAVVACVVRIQRRKRIKGEQ